MLLGIVLLITAGAVAGILLARSRHHERSEHASAGPLIAIGTISAAMLALTGFILWKLLNRPEYQRVMRYNWRRRMRVAKALRREDSLSPDDVPVADAIVGAMRNQRWILWFQPVLIASWILMAVMRHGTGRWLYGGFALVMGPAWLYAFRMQGRVIRSWDARTNRPPGDRQGAVDG
jgi:hypothetical protein